MFLKILYWINLIYLEPILGVLGLLFLLTFVESIFFDKDKK